MINKKKLLIYTTLTSMIIGLNGCKKNEEDYYDYSTVEITTENVTTEAKTTEQITTEKITTEFKEEKSNNFDCFEGAKEEIQKYINEENYEQAKKKGKEYFVTAVDFIFYGTEINGYTFDELSEENKTMTYNNLCVIDGWIMTVDPDYKENLSEKYNKVKQFTKDKYNDAKELIKEKIGEETYNKIGKTKDNVKEEIKEQSKKVKKKVKDWYEDFRN